MSSSTPDKRKSPSKPAPFKPLHERGRDSFWLTVSIVLHVAALGVLWLTPVRQILFKPTDPEEFQVVARAERIEEMTEYLRDRESAVMETKVEEMLFVEHELDQILNQMDEQFQELADDLAGEAQDKALAAQQEALKAQREALKGEDEAIGRQQELETQRVAAAQAKDAEFLKLARQKADQASGDTQQMQGKVRDAQGRAGDAQEKARQAMAFASKEFDAARAAHAEAEARQKEASRLQDQASGLQEAGHEARQDAQRKADTTRRQASSSQAGQRRVEESRQRLTEAKAKVAEATARLAEAKQKGVQARLDSDKAARDAASGKAVAARTKTRADRDAAKKAESAARRAKSDKASAQRAEERAFSELSSLKKRIESAQRKLADDQKRLASAEASAKASAQAAKEAGENSERLHLSAVKKQAEARAAQARAIQAQSQAVASLQKAIESVAGQGQLARKAAQAPPEATRRSELPAPVPVTSRKIGDLYNHAVATEQRIAEKYRNVHATKVAMIRRVPVADALADAVAPKVDRPPLAQDLQGAPVRTAEAAKAHKAEIDRANQEVDAMVAGAQRLLNMARAGQGGDQGMGASLASIKAAGAQDAQLRQLAAEDEGARHKDLAGAMRGAAAAPSAGQQGPPRAGVGKGRKGPGWSPDPYALTGSDPKVMPARKFLASAASHPTDRWVYVPTWYTIGPFPNPNRRNMDTQFPPEEIVDLDAVYTGKGGRRIKWDFLKSPGAMVTPANAEPYGIWYAYTELWFEQAMDLTIAVGSDDHSRVWIEGKPVWLSGRELKPWRANEGYRTVHFRKGLNRVLVRVENGWRGMGFSLLICMKPVR